MFQEKISIICEKIETQNKKTQSLLWFEEIIKNNQKELLYKIIHVAVSKYQDLFTVNGKYSEEKYMQYLEDIYRYTDEVFMKKENLKKKEILDFHALLFSSFSENELRKMKIKNTGNLRKKSVIAYNLYKSHKLKNKNDFIPHSKVENTFVETINKYNLSDKNIIDISIFFHKCISYIHPFDNGNGRVFFLLFDILLLKNDYLPCFIKQDKDRYEKVIQAYFTHKNFNKLIYNFLEFILYKYENYNIQ